MPYALLLAGALLVVAAVRNTQADLFALLKGDFTGPKNFVFWFSSIMAVGSLGYIPKLKPLSNALLVLVVVVLFLSNKGFFAQLEQQLKSTEAPKLGDQKTPGSGGLKDWLKIPELPKLF
jgi:hypothetical protein